MLCLLPLYPVPSILNGDGWAVLPGIQLHNRIVNLYRVEKRVVDFLIRLGCTDPSTRL